MEEFKQSILTRLSEIESDARETGNQVIHSKVFNEYNDKLKGWISDIEANYTAVQESGSENKPDLTVYFIQVDGMTIEQVVTAVESVKNIVSFRSSGFVQ